MKGSVGCALSLALVPRNLATERCVGRKMVPASQSRWQAIAIVDDVDISDRPRSGLSRQATTAAPPTRPCPHSHRLLLLQSCSQTTA
mgnify:CR=1 FL=1